MRVKTSITPRAGRNRSGSTRLAACKRQERDRRDLAIINRNAKSLNREAMDTLRYQQLS